MMDAAALVARELAVRNPDARVQFLQELLAHTAAGLVIMEDDERAAEACYRVADAVVARKASAA